MKKFLFLITALPFFAGCGEEPLNAHNPGKDIVAFGDSLTAGYGAGEKENYPYYLSRLLGRDIVNLGVSGNTAADGAARKYEIARYNPYMVLIEFGGNDAILGRPLSQTKTALAEITDYAQKLGAVAVVVDTGGNFKMNPYTKIMKQLSKEKRAIFVPAIMKGIFYKPDLKSDAIHPNAKGYKLIAEKVHKKIKPYIKN
jgi:lysophospholipase L1-like esterase